MITKIDLACGPQEIELFIIKNAPARVNYPEALGLRHLAFKVENVDDTVKALNGKGIETEPVRLDDYTGKKMTFSMIRMDFHWKFMSRNSIK